ncbi:MAG: hypothetical protein PVJ08_07775 [Dehalococcoidia bacterium]|jgi:hypothetical protein
MVDWEQSNIPRRYVVGVTGHRDLMSGELFVKPLRTAIRNIVTRETGPDGRLPELVVLSALAEGADRLVAWEILAIPGSRLEVVLPMGRNDYAQDFKTDESQKEYEQLLDRAVMVNELPARNIREESYEQAGHYIVDHCDILLALWNGKPAAGQGGTGDIVRYAKDKKRPIVRIYPHKQSDRC